MDLREKIEFDAVDFMTRLGWGLQEYEFGSLRRAIRMITAVADEFPWMPMDEYRNTDDIIRAARDNDTRLMEVLDGYAYSVRKWWPLDRYKRGPHCPRYGYGVTHQVRSTHHREHFETIKHRYEVTEFESAAVVAIARKADELRAAGWQVSQGWKSVGAYTGLRYTVIADQSDYRIRYIAA